MPDLRGLAPAGGDVVQATVALRSTYFDTADLALLRHGLTLRRREGDTDQGWQMKVPDGDARTEIRLPLSGEETVPVELADLLTGIALGAPLEVMAVVRTNRRVQRLNGSDGVTLLEAADDTVSATALGEAVTLSAWREIELELGSGTEALLAKAGRRLLKAGARQSKDASKLGRALGTGPSTTSRTAPPTGSAAAALSNYLSDQVHALMVGDVDLRRGLDPIHPTRVATRRLRSTIRVFAGMFDTAAAQDLDRELVWFAALLGEVRDRQVQRERFASAIADLPAELILGPVAAMIEQRLLSEQLAARRTLMAELSGQRYLTLLASVAAWAVDPPLSPLAQGDAQILVRMARKAGRTATRRLKAALRPGADDAALHSARKSAKRARYAWEAVAPIIGPKASKTRIKAVTTVQEVLGEHQDSLIAADVLRRLGAEAGSTPDQNGFTYGLLYAREQRIAQESRATAAGLLP